ncbi:MAG TPA: hypothetical protein VFS43_19200 [Polyangiaceae bacterium]|nr:hypothetical protein [Polyangiaceae bacterium]
MRSRTSPSLGRAVALLLAFGALGPAACSGVDGPAAPGERGSAIKSGTKDDGVKYPETVILNGLDAEGKVRIRATGAVIAPRVVLTAGHVFVAKLVSDLKVKTWCVLSPATDKKAAAKLAEAPHDDAHAKVKDLKTEDLDTSLLNGHHDIGLLLLDKGQDIKLDKYPELANEPLPDSTNEAPVKVIQVGRIDDGKTTESAFYRKNTLMTWLADTTKKAYELDYTGYYPIMEPGDSGGPVEAIVGDTDTHKIVAVNSRVVQLKVKKEDDKGVDLLARVDPLCEWINGHIKDAGGGGPGCPAKALPKRLGAPPPADIAPPDASPRGAREAPPTGYMFVSPPPEGPASIGPSLCTTGDPACEALCPCACGDGGSGGSGGSGGDGGGSSGGSGGAGGSDGTGGSGGSGGSNGSGGDGGSGGSGGSGGGATGGSGGSGGGMTGGGGGTGGSGTGGVNGAGGSGTTAGAGGTGGGGGPGGTGGSGTGGGGTGGSGTGGFPGTGGTGGFPGTGGTGGFPGSGGTGGTGGFPGSGGSGGFSGAGGTGGAGGVTASCVDQCGVYDESFVCQCDDLCVEYEDCCPDKIALCGDELGGSGGSGGGATSGSGGSGGGATGGSGGSGGGTGGGASGFGGSHVSVDLP